MAAPTVGSTSPPVSSAARSATAMASASSGLTCWPRPPRSPRISASARNRLQARSTAARSASSTARASARQRGSVTTSRTRVPRARQLAAFSGTPAGVWELGAGPQRGPGARAARVRAGGRHHEPPEVAWLLPELDDGAEPELKPEFEFELDEPELDEPELDEPELDEPDLTSRSLNEVDLEDPELVEPELGGDPELDDEPEPVDVDEEAALCVDPGRVSATMPAAATPAMVTVVVTERTLARPRSRSVVARRIRSRYSLLMKPILRSRTRSLLQETSRLAMNQAPGAAARR